MNRIQQMLFPDYPDGWLPDLAPLLDPLAYDLLQQLETGSFARFEAERFYGSNLVPIEFSIADIARSFGPLAEYSAPDQHTEKVRYYDVTGLVAPYRRTPGDELVAGVHVVELVRQPIPVNSVAVIETIATWLRVHADNPGGEAVDLELFNGVVAPPVQAQGTPFPFPLAHPVNGTLSVEWLLIREGVPDAGFGVQPAFVGPQVSTVEFIPCDYPVLSPWRDMRYPWDASDSNNQSWIVGDRSLLRLFATITITGDPWRVEIAGRLAGYIQITGYLKAALAAATQRH